jgi:hypothetical protein
MRHVTDSSGTRWEVAFIGGSAVGARGGRDAFSEEATDTIVFTTPDGKKVDRTTIAGRFSGMTNEELVGLLEEKEEDADSGGT